MEFQEWPKIARLNRDIVVTEKIDGTNAAVVIEDLGTVLEGFRNATIPRGALGVWIVDGREYAVGAQSRKTLLQLGQDNFGFALWVSTNAEVLIETLGAGRHFGEWWGSGIQRGYGIAKGVKHFSLFNTLRHRGTHLEFADGTSLSTVPRLYEGPYDPFMIEQALGDLRAGGSATWQARGFPRAEGIIVYHTAANGMFKVTLENDEKPKGQS